MLRHDLQCATAASKLAGDNTFSKKDEKLVADAASVLASQGVYAFSVFLRARSIKEPKAKKLLLGCGQLIGFLEPTTPPKTPESVVLLASKISENLHNLLLAKRLIAEMLTYLKYHLKSKPDPTPAAQPVTAPGIPT